MTDRDGVGPLVVTRWLADRIGDPDIVVLDCAWAIPEAAVTGVETFLAGHISGARHFDLDAASDPGSPYVNMLPSPEHFCAYVGALGIDASKTVIVYDSSYVAARVWWMFRHFGHDKVAILDGGLGRWKAEGRPIETGPAAPAVPAVFIARKGSGRVADLGEITHAVETGGVQLVDARSPARFSGLEPSGYPGVPGGHMPGAVNLPWSRLLNTSGPFGFAEPQAARAALEAAGIDLARPVIATCGSGVTACILILALDRLGHRDWKLYDGSWHEWAQQPDLPKVGLDPASGG